MKLVMCLLCQDIVRPYPGRHRTCHCMKVSVTASRDNKTITVTGKNNVVLGLSNTELVEAVNNRPYHGKDDRSVFKAFVMSEDSQNIIRL